MKKKAHHLINRIKRINSNHLLIYISMVVGVFTGLAAVVLKNLVLLILLFAEFIKAKYGAVFLFIFPIFGISITLLFTQFILKKPIKGGVPLVLKAISRFKGKIDKHNMFSSMLTSAFTVGFGGSMGLEGPSIATGAALGSNIGQRLNLNYKQLLILMGCGCAGSISALFNAPIAAIIFVLEVVMIDLTVTSIVPLLVASVTAALVSYYFLGQNVLYYAEVTNRFYLNSVPYFVLLGVFTGFCSLYFSRSFLFVTKLLDLIKKPFVKLLIGSTLLGGLIIFLPNLYGEGYESTNIFLSGKYFELFEKGLFINPNNNILFTILPFGLLLLLKPIASGLTKGSGGIGGIFAPSLFVGTCTGIFFVLIMKLFHVNLSPTDFALVGMAGMIAGVLHAPLTSIFLIAEITGGYELLIPLMIVAIISYTIVRIFMPFSVYTIQLEEAGDLITHHKDRAVLKLMRIDNLIETDFSIIAPDQTLGGLTKVITKAHRNIFPVVQSDGTFRGMIKMDDIRHFMFNYELYNEIFVRDIMFIPDQIIEYGENIEAIAKKFEISGHYNIAVVQRGVYLGFISRAKLFSSYREILQDISEE